jgi:hypothetical protein
MGLDFVGVDPGAAVTFRDGGGGPGRPGYTAGSARYGTASAAGSASEPGLLVMGCSVTG